MNVTDNFYEAMINTEPSDMLLLDSKSYTRFVSKSDPIFGEILVASEARNYGITTLEYRTRKAAASKACLKRPRDEYVTCDEAMLWGISEQAYKQRLPLTSQCKLSPQEQQLVDNEALEWRTAADHPLLAKRKACERSVMLAQ